jgi:tRNA(Ile)-lysidine synthase
VDVMSSQTSRSAPQPPFLAKLEESLRRLPVAFEQAPRVSVAFSGGVDSTVLLASLVSLRIAGELRALHVDHGLASESADWARHCRDVAARFGVDCRVSRVVVGQRGGRGLEAAARAARYAAIREQIVSGEIVVTAHHGDDQLETVLLRLVRGAGVAGLAAIADWSGFGPGFLARPLLDFTRGEIVAEAERLGLTWLEDPANADLHHDRNYMRREVVPKLVARWPAAARAAVRMSRNARDADRLLDELALADLGAVTYPPRIPRARLRDLDPARRRNALRHLIERSGLPIPDSRQLEELDRSLAVIRPDARVCVRWPGAEARTYRDYLYLLAPLPQVDAPPAAKLAPEQPWRGVGGQLELVFAAGPGLPDVWARSGLEIRFRRGGERFKPQGDAHQRTLKYLFQEAGIVPWMRDRVPLLYWSDRLVAVADLWLVDDVEHVVDGEPRWRVVWTEHPPLH